MARISADNDSSSTAQIAPKSIQIEAETAQNILISPMGQSEVPVPGLGFVTNSIMTQDGSDLILETPDGVTLIIEGYFSGTTPPDLISSDGKVLTPALVKSFIQASTEYAEETIAMTDVSPVGSIQEVSGNATVTRADGTKEALAKGMSVFEGDVIETDAKGAVNVDFIDDSSFAISNNAKMAVDEFVFDAKTNGGENNFSMLRGLFVYTSGLIGREDPDDVKIKTPVGSIGIRGTIITGDIPEEGSNRPAQISVIEGAIVVEGVNGSEHTLSKQFETLQIDNSGTATNIGVLSETSMAETFNVLRTVAPTLFSAMEEAQQEAAPDAQDIPQAPVEAAPDQPAETESQPQDTAPESAPDVIQLNLVPGRLDTNSLDKALAEVHTDDPLRKLPSLGAAEQMQAVSVASVSVAPVLTVAPPVLNIDPVVLAPQPAPVITSPPVVAPPVTPPVDQPPVRLLATFGVEEQALIKGQTHQFDISRYFSDDHGILSYNVTQLAGSSISSIAVSSTGVVTVTMGTSTFTNSSPVSFTVSAVDSSNAASSDMTVNMFAYVYNGSIGSTGVDTGTNTENGKNFSLQSGSDIVTFSGNQNQIFGGTGHDEIRLDNFAEFNKVYGDGGNDHLYITGGEGNMLSGGTADDNLYISLRDSSYHFKAYGGLGNDVIRLENQEAIDAMSNSATRVDGGTGFDTLVMAQDAMIDLTSFAATALNDIEKIKLQSSTGSQITLDLTDLLKNAHDNNSLFLDVSSLDTVQVQDSTGMGALTFTGQVVSDPHTSGESYKAYSNGSVTLYLSTDATVANVIGAIAA